jgi:hypothetical protein
MAGTNTTTRNQRRRQAKENLAEQGDGMAQTNPTGGELDVDDSTLLGDGVEEPAVVEHTLGARQFEGEQDLAELEAAVARNQGATVEQEINMDDGPRIGVDVHDRDLLLTDADELPEPVVTEVRLALGQRFGTRTVRLVHRAGCPGEPDRVESYPYETPRGARGVMTRCQDCAEQTPTRLTAPRRS